MTLERSVRLVLQTAWSVPRRDSSCTFFNSGAFSVCSRRFNAGAQEAAHSDFSVAQGDC